MKQLANNAMDSWGVFKPAASSEVQVWSQISFFQDVMATPGNLFSSAAYPSFQLENLNQPGKTPHSHFRECMD